MSVTRQMIADALTEVVGITGSPTSPRTPSRGLGWPVWQRTVPRTMTGHEITWEVVIALPNAMPEASELEADDLTLLVAEVLEELGEVVSIEPGAIVTQQAGAQQLPVLIYTLTTV